MSRDAGFTLLETLVAVAVFALLASAGTFVIVQSMAARDAVAASRQAAFELQSGREFLRRDLAQVRLRGVRDAFGTSRAYAFAGEGGSLQLLTAAWPNPAAAGDRSVLQWVEYRLEEGQFIRRAFLRPDITLQTRAAERILMRNVQAVSFHYYARGQWLDSYLAAHSRPSAPGAVSLSMTFSDGTSIRQLFLAGGGGP